MRTFLRVSDRKLIPLDEVTMVSTGEMENLILRVKHSDGNWHRIEGNDAIEALMLIKPSALEGRRLRWEKRAWLVHNLVGHPLMQVLALFGQHDLAIRVHDRTIPKPVGAKQ